jgi:asparagine N-glycosylation enzyme membrane subunit Stt3
MKQILSILTVICLFSFSAIAQSGQSQPADEKAFMQQQFNNYADALNLTPQQKQSSEQVLNQRFDQYTVAKSNITDPSTIRQLRGQYVSLALKDMQPFLTSAQWAEVEKMVAGRENVNLN